MMKRWLALMLAALLMLGGACSAQGAADAEASADAQGAAPTEEWAWVELPTPVDIPLNSLPLYGVIIGLDPGHQRHGDNTKEAIAPGSSETKRRVSSGTSGVKTRVDEYVVNLQIGLKLRDALEALGATVYMTRETHDVDLSNQDRAKMLNEKHCDLALRLHCDGADSPGPNGIGLYVSKSNSIAVESYRAAECLMQRMTEATGARDNGIHKSDSYTGNNWSEVPCVLVEMGFMSNPEEDVKLNDPDYQDKLVEGIVNGIFDFMGRGYE